MFSSHPNSFDWPCIRTVWICFHPSLYLFLEQFEDLFPNVYTIAVHTGIAFSLFCVERFHSIRLDNCYYKNTKLSNYHS